MIASSALADGAAVVSSEPSRGDRSPRGNHNSRMGASARGEGDNSLSLGIHPFVVTLFAVLMAAVGVYIAAPQLFNEAYWLTHQFHEAKTTPSSRGDAGARGRGAAHEGKDASDHGGEGEDGAWSSGGDGADAVEGGGQRDVKETAGAKKASTSPSPSPSPRSPSSSRPRGARSKPSSGGGKSGRKRSSFEKVGSDEARAKTPKVYDVGVTCKQHWREMAKKMLEPWAEGVQRDSMGKMPKSVLGHTPMWLRVIRGKLHCVLDPRFKNDQLRLKPYRARHYVQRVNAILQSGKSLPENLEWWSHHSDLSKVPKGIELVDGLPPPIMAVAGGPEFWDIPGARASLPTGIPFMSFSDAKSVGENEGYKEVKTGKTFDERWAAKKTKAFFLGGLSDCGNAVKNHDSDPNFCGRAKMVRYAARLAESGETDLLSAIQVYDYDSEASKLLEGCERCTRPALKGQAFVRELMDHKYVLNFDGAGNWSRRMSVLLNSGSVVVKAESPGFQFYEYGLEPGVHYVPFDPMVGKEDPGNLRPRLEWLAEFDDVARQLAQRAESFGEACLSEHSINDFVYELLAGYGRLQRGRPAPYKTVDISECFDRKSCRNKLEPCWGLVGGAKSKGGR